METVLNKDERIEIRISNLEKQLFKKAQLLSGDASFSSFVVRVVKSYAEEIVSKNNQILASESDRQQFFEAVFSDQKPNQQLIDAADKYKSTVETK